MAQQATILRIESFEPSTGGLSAITQNGGLPKYPQALIGADITLSGRLAGKVSYFDGKRMSAKVLPGGTRRLISEGVVFGLSISSDGIRFTDQTIAKRAPVVKVHRRNANDFSKAGIVGSIMHTLQNKAECAAPKYSDRRLNKNAYLIGRI